MSAADRSLATSASALQNAVAAGGARTRQCLTTGVRTVAFWAAAALPIAYAPFVAGVGPGTSVELLGALLGVHALCLAIGHDHADADGHDPR